MHQKTLIIWGNLDNITEPSFSGFFRTGMLIMRANQYSIRAVVMAVMAMSMLIQAGPVLAIGPSDPGTGNGCGMFIEKVSVARRSGIMAMVRETYGFLSAKSFEKYGLGSVEAVKCASKNYADAFKVTNMAVAAGIPRAEIKEGLERDRITFGPLQKIEKKTLPGFITEGRTRLEFILHGGVGSTNPIIGNTAEGKDVELGGGGGFGGGITIGRGLTPNWDFDLTLGYQVSVLDPEPDYSKGGFERYYAVAAIKYRLRTSDRSWIKFGLGAAYYEPVRYEAELYDSHFEIDYGGAPGGQVSLEYEAALGSFTTSSTFVFGVRYYYVTYEAEAINSYGESMPLSGLAGSLLELDGSGTDITFGLVAWY